MAKSAHELTDLGKLCVAILESRVKSLIGDDAVKILRKTYDEKKLQVSLEEALVQTETRFRKEHGDEQLVQGLLNLPIADLPSIRGAVRDFYDHPGDPALAKLLTRQFMTDYPGMEPRWVEAAVNTYLAILREELVSVDHEIREKMIALSLIGIKSKVDEISTADQLFAKFSRGSPVSQYIRVNEFRTLVTERSSGFVGREFAFQAIDDLLKDPRFPSGYIVISGEPGIGKTALVAQFVKTRQYIHHFNTVLQDIRSTKDFLANICAQLIVRYDLEHSALPPEATKNSEFLLNLLEEAVRKSENLPIVVLVDALDEVEADGEHEGANCLCLPPDLPAGVFFVVTEREEFDDRLSVSRRKDLYLKDDDPRNLDDVRRYINRFIEDYRTQMAPRINEWHIAEDEFVDAITKGSEGNFMYLVHVLADIRDGTLTSSNIKNIRRLPRGLRAYYHRHWRAMRAVEPAVFDQYYKPVLCILATVKEPVTIAQLIEWTGVVPDRIHTVITRWRQYLNEDETAEGEPLYRVYHRSFQAFLEEEVGLRRYHRIIVETALGKIKW